jgi:ElaB/YqjD/DUF883 family membrane-anchored ribosome-binding protein
MAQTTDVQREIDSLKADLKTLRNDLSELSKTSGKMAGDSVQAARDALRDEADKLIDRLKKTASAAQEEGEQVAGQIRDEVAEKPLPSLLTAFGVGTLVGWLISRK